MKKPKFEYYEIVRVCSKNEELREIFGKEAMIVSIEHDEYNQWYYFISIEEDDDGWCVMEQDIESLGRFGKKEDILTGEHIKVGVNEKGEGYLKEEE